MMVGCSISTRRVVRTTTAPFSSPRSCDQCEDMCTTRRRVMVGYTIPCSSCTSSRSANNDHITSSTTNDC